MRNLTTLRKGLLPPLSRPAGMVLSAREKSKSPQICFKQIPHKILNLLKISLKKHRRIHRQIITNLKTLQIHITKDNEVYKNKNGTKKIRYSDNQFHWTSPEGGWKTFNQNGYLVQYGTEEGIIARLIYVDDKLTTIQDRYEQTIYTYEYEENKITITDYSGRKVVYETTGLGAFPYRLRLNKVTTFSEGSGGNEIVTSYEYNNRLQLVSKTLPEGRTYTMGYDGNGNVVRLEDSKGFGYSYAYGYANKLFSVTEQIL